MEPIYVRKEMRKMIIHYLFCFENAAIVKVFKN